MMRTTTTGTDDPYSAHHDGSAYPPSPGQVSDDTALFRGEIRRATFSRDLKIKLIFAGLALLVLLAAFAYIRHRMSEGWNTGQPTTRGVDETVAQRKARVFETDAAESRTKPPIVLPMEVLPLAPQVPPALATEGLGLELPQTAPTRKAMMLGDQSLGSTSLQPTNHLTGGFDKADGSQAARGDSLTLLDALSSGSNKSASASLTALNPSGFSSGRGKPLAATIERQAQVARDAAGTQVTATAQISAAQLGRRSYVLAKGGFIPCVLETQLVSNVFGMASCVVTQGVYSDDGKMLLIERGSRVTGNYGSNLRNGDSRLAVVWDRIKTPKGVTVDVNSPATDGLGAMGMPGIVDKHWFERIAGAIMLSLVQDGIQYASSTLAYNSYLKEQRQIANTQLPVQTASTTSSQTTTTVIDPETGNATTTVINSGQGPVSAAQRAESRSNPPPVPVFGGNNTAKQGASIPEQVLAASINATATLYKNRGDVVYIFVANDLWFDRVYGLKE
jgi:type IV secretory pathway VirB10-like protein